MRLALLADIHANLEALDACLADARRRGVDGYAFLGDLVGYGADPRAVLEKVAEHAARGAIVVRGNHDATVLDPIADTLNRTADRVVAWTRSQLDDAHRAFIRSLPLTVRRDATLFVHASAEEPEQWLYLNTGERVERCLAADRSSTYIFCGHVHLQWLYHSGRSGGLGRFQPVPGNAVPVSPRRRWVSVVGSAGQPRDGNTAACYAIIDYEKQRLTYLRVPYDWDVTARKVLAAGLPDLLAARLARGE